MEEWKKAAILGGIWGIISFVMVLAFPLSIIYPKSLSIKIFEGIEIILFLPAYIGISLLNRLAPAGELVFIFTITGSILIGVFLGLIIYRIYMRLKQLF
ncbi:MAG: hypothetical protein WA102_05655 [Candidatus Methanoperedens sp.]